MKYKCLILLLLLFGFWSTAQAKLILTSPPRETAKAGEKFYGTIAKALSQYIGVEVAYKHPKNWTEYARDMRGGKYDIIFDGPHFASWRMVHLDHQPIASLDGKLQFVIVTPADSKHVKKLKDVLGKKLCGLPSPNLGTLAAFNLFDNPIIQPTVSNVKNMKTVVKDFFKGQCDAAVFLSNIYDRFPDEKKNKIRVLARTRLMPNQSFTASKHIDLATRNKIRDFFLSPNGSQAADSLLERFSKKKKYFVGAEDKEFSGLNELLEGVVFGW